MATARSGSAVPWSSCMREATQHAWNMSAIREQKPVRRWEGRNGSGINAVISMVAIIDLRSEAWGGSQRRSGPFSAGGTIVIGTTRYARRVFLF